MKSFKLYTHNKWKKYAWESVNDSKYIQWDIKHCYYGDPHPPPEKHEKVFYTSSELEHALNHNCATKIAYMEEAWHIVPWYYDYLDSIVENFDIVLTHNTNILKKYPDQGVFYPHCNCIIPREDFNLYGKDRLISFISSIKNMKVPGHILRHGFYDIYINRQQNWANRLVADKQIDLFGTLPGNHVSNKLASLKRYMFQIVFENSIADIYFTEKILDCFVTGTIPIYYGTKKINDFFNPEGILHFTTLEELFNVINDLSPEVYSSKRQAIADNFNCAQDFIVAEDWIFENTSVFD